MLLFLKEDKKSLILIYLYIIIIINYIYNIKISLIIKYKEKYNNFLYNNINNYLLI
jgi:hypothetical protein